MRRAVVDRIGGLDEQFGSGNFEDDDFCLRAAQVGFAARVAEDVFIHPTGSQTFKATGIDYRQSMECNWELFKAKWGIPMKSRVEQGYRLPLRRLDESELFVRLPDMSARWWAKRQELGSAATPFEGGISALALTGGTT